MPIHRPLSTALNGESVLQSGFVKLRRGILQHLSTGQISADEYCVFSILILLADHHTGIWLGCALAVSRYTHWSVRQCQRALKGLREKGYIEGGPTNRGRGRYRIKVLKYFDNKASGESPSATEGVWGVALSPKKATGEATYQEVIQEEGEEGLQHRQPRPLTRWESREIELQKELRVGQGPSLRPNPSVYRRTTK